MNWIERREMEKALMNRLGAPRDDIDRAYFHYQGRNLGAQRSLLEKMMREIPAMLLALPALLFFRARNLFPGKKSPCDAVCFCPEQVFLKIMMEDLPPELTAEFPQMQTHTRPASGLVRYAGARLDRQGAKLWWKAVRRRPAAFYVNFYLLLHLAHCCELIYTYAPKAIISAQTESDFATSLLTEYCESKRVLYIGIMHGETVRSMIRAYVRFSRFYVWNEETAEMFIATGSPREIFRIYDSKRLLPCYQAQEHPAYFLSYYLGGEKEPAMRELKERLDILAKRGLKCKVRPHPRATDMAAFHQIFDGGAVETEDVRQVSLKDSVENSEYIASVCSTVLSEAYASKMKIVIDDMSSYITIDDLRDRMYINLKRPHLPLSELLRQVKAQ